MNNKDKYYTKIDKYWIHRSPLKLVVNPILRKLQFYTDKPYAIASYTTFTNGVPHFKRYMFVRMKLLNKALSNS